MLRYRTNVCAIVLFSGAYWIVHGEPQLNYWLAVCMSYNLHTFVSFQKLICHCWIKDYLYWTVVPLAFHQSSAVFAIAS